jgi:probable DNA metabolism protein
MAASLRWHDDMHSVLLSSEDDFDGWRDAARALAGAAVPAGEISWQVGNAGGDLFAAAAPLPSPPVAFSVPRAFLTLAETAVCHSDPERFALLYALLLRLRERPGLLSDGADPLVQRLERLAKAVRRDIHKMRAFLRFREVETAEARATSLGSSPSTISSAPMPASSSAALRRCAGRS